MTRMSIAQAKKLGIDINQGRSKTTIFNKNTRPVADKERYKLIIPGELPTMNEIIDEAKTHWNNYREQKNDQTELVAWEAKRAKLPYIPVVKFEITYFRKSRAYDPDNIAAAKKFILDGLVEAGVLENDGWKQIKGWSEDWSVDSINPRVEVVLINIRGEIK